MDGLVVAKKQVSVNTKTKVCFKCGEIKPVVDFYKHPQMGDGRLNKCKECNKKDVQQNYRKNKAYYQEYEERRAMLPHRVKLREEYQKTPEGKRAVARGEKAYRKRYPEKYRAHVKFGNAVRDGKITRGKCVFCGKHKNIHGHHCDYTKPLDVMWLCQKHHAWVHSLVKTKILTAA